MLLIVPAPQLLSEGNPVLPEHNPTPHCNVLSLTVTGSPHPYVCAPPCHSHSQAHLSKQALALSQCRLFCLGNVCLLLAQQRLTGRKLLLPAGVVPSAGKFNL